MGPLTVTERYRSGPVEWAVSGRPYPGQLVSGDAFVVAPTGEDEDRVVLAVADGLGHGPDAEAASSLAVQTVRDHAGVAVDALLELCHDALKDTRGAAMTIASLDVTSATVTWLGVGNVKGCILRGDVVGTSVVEIVPLASGIVGFQLSVPRPQTVQLQGGEVILMVTDGVVLPPPERVHPRKSVASTAQEILDRGALESDDALVLVARYQGRG